MGQPISTASDIYSLGLLLYLMIAEVPPYELKELTTETMLRFICTEEPQPPSFLAISAERPDADLDAIVLKALRKEPQERFISVDQFAGDILFCWRKPTGSWGSMEKPTPQHTKPWLSCLACK